jgi:two-component SAPR family response regulator
MIITRQPGRFFDLAKGLSENNSNEIIWADSLKSAYTAASGSIDLIVIDEKVEEQTGLDIVKEVVRINAMANLALVSSLSSDEFHEVSEGLGIMAQLPPDSDGENAGFLLNCLNKLIVNSIA